MKRLLGIGLVAALALAMAPTAFAGEKRADTYYTVNCIDPDGNHVVAESVDAHAIEQGGKAAAIELFNEHHDGWLCWAEGPFGG